MITVTPKMAGKFLKVATICVLFGCVYSSVSRSVNSTAWPGCDLNEHCKHANKTGELPHIVYTKASTPNHDTLHYVFSTKGGPTILMARTTAADTDMKFDWDIILSNQTSFINGIKFTNPDKIKIDYKFGVCFTKLIEYGDADDDANLVDLEKSKDKHKEWNIRPFSEIKWEPLNLDDISENKFVFNTTDDNALESNNGTLTFSFHIPSKDGRISALPSQKYTANETLFEFLLDQFTPTLNKSRFAMEAVAVSLGSDKKMDVDTVKTIDDEYSPGVFLLTNWLTDPSHTSTSGFVQWKPVSYFGKTRGRKTVTKVKHYDLFELEEADDTTLNATLVSALFGDNLFGKSDIKKMNISFGQPKDGYYLKNNYTVWDAAIGYGTPPKDEISMTVIIIIATGLGIPVLLCIVGGVYTISKVVRKKKSQYEAINGSSSINQDRTQ